MTTKDIEFNFSNLKNLYSAALNSSDKTMAFDVAYGNGRSLFMMYLSEEDVDAKDKLFVFMRNTRVMREIKMYGNHIKGDFRVFFNEKLKEQFIQELQLGAGNGGFDFQTFLGILNSRIPQEVSQAEKLRTLRNNRELFKAHVDEAEKTVLIGDMYVANGKPRDKTLRKLYLYTDSPSDEIENLITILKGLNRTLKWTTEDERYKATSTIQILTVLQEQTNNRQ